MECCSQLTTAITEYAPGDREGRFFFFFGGTRSTTTTTFTTITTTATSISLLNCIPSTLFATTTGCRRRRSFYESSGLEDFLSPSETKGVETTVLPAEAIPTVPELMSSKSEEVHHIKKRGIVFVTTTIQSTLTSFSFSVSTFTSTITLGNANNVLLCLPTGYSLCT